MTQTFNKVRYIKLLKKDQSLESKNSSLYKEDRVEYRELLSYGVILYNQIIYNGFLFDTDLLTSKNISEGFVIYEKLSV